MGAIRVLYVVVFVNTLCIASCSIFGFEYPWHASCKIDWTFGDSCSSVNQAIVNQINAWSSDDCGTGQKCLYELKSSTAEKIEATHTTPVHRYVDNLTFTFKSSANKCEVEGYSTSTIWYAVLDYGTNYCNLHNLIIGAELDKKPGYEEKTSNSICTQYTSADCDKY